MWIERRDLLYTIRSARRAPLLSIIAVVALSLGIGLNAGVFTLLNALFLNLPTQTDPSRFVQIYPRYEGWFTGAGSEWLNEGRNSSGPRRWPFSIWVTEAWCGRQQK
jgi:hypothetical protein